MEDIDELFSPIPLENMFNANTDTVISLIDRQTEVYEQELASAGDIMPPEMRIKKITGSGLVHLTFTNAMDFPDDLKDRIN